MSLWTLEEVTRLRRYAESGLFIREAAERLGRSYKSVKKKAWSEKVEFKAAPTGYTAHRDPEGMKRRAAAMAAARWKRDPHAKRPPQLARGFSTSIEMPHLRDWSPAAQAADFLRRFSAVWRCDAGGRPNPQGSHWRRGSAVLSDAELIARADALRGRAA